MYELKELLKNIEWKQLASLYSDGLVPSSHPQSMCHFFVDLENNLQTHAQLSYVVVVKNTMNDFVQKHPTAPAERTGK